MSSGQKAQSPNVLRGNSRAAQNRKIRRDALREELRGRAYIRHILEITERLDPSYKSKDERSPAYTPEQVPAAKARCDNYFRLLDKCLPSLRPVDLPVTLNTKGEGLTAQGQSVIQALAKGDLTPSEATALLQALAALSRIVESEGDHKGTVSFLFGMQNPEKREGETA